MSRRKENIRRACDRLNQLADSLEYDWHLNTYADTIRLETHRIKRTTWRGEKDGHRPELRLSCTCKTCSPAKRSVKEVIKPNVSY